MNESAIREQICQIGKMLWQEGYTPYNAGNICVKLNDREYLATPTGCSKGLMTPDMILKITFDPDKPEDERIQTTEALSPYALTSEIKVHLQAMLDLPGMNATVHTHSPYAQFWACSGEKYVMPPAEHFPGRPVPIVPFKPYGTWELAYGNSEALKESKSGVIMGEHGPLTVGKDLVSAWMAHEMLEHVCHAAYLAKVAGK